MTEVMPVTIMLRKTTILNTYNAQLIKQISDQNSSILDVDYNRKLYGPSICLTTYLYMYNSEEAVLASPGIANL